MTVAELIEKLKALPQDLEVVCAAFDRHGLHDHDGPIDDPRLIGRSHGADRVEIYSSDRWV